MLEELPGTNCAAGGVVVKTGLDANGNGQLDIAEVQSTSYVCHGTGGPDAQSFTLQYSAQAGGSILGSVIQTVLLGDSGGAVTAVPNTGYFFTSWSDGVTSPVRTEAVVQSSLSVQAGFSSYQYTLAYTAGSGGSISGIVGQTIF